MIERCSGKAPAAVPRGRSAPVQSIQLIGGPWLPAARLVRPSGSVATTRMSTVALPMGGVKLKLRPLRLIQAGRGLPSARVAL